jgi:phage tail sheath gpL-like
MLLLCVLYIIGIAAKGPTYTRDYLRGQKKIADDVRRNQLLHEGIKAIETAIFTAASNGLTEYTPPFYGCQDPRTLDDCEYVVPRIHAVIARRFPDSEITYDEKRKRYTIKW